MSFGNLLIKKHLKCSLPLAITMRQGHTIRGKPPGVAKTLEQRLQLENVQDAEATARINIGFPRLRAARAQQLSERLQHLKLQRSNEQLEKQARDKSLLIDLAAVQQEYCRSTGQYDLRVIADHYGIFEHLFGSAYFVPRVPLHIVYKTADADALLPVHCGNALKPADVAQAPEVQFDGTLDPITGLAQKPSETSYWTLIATNPDCHLSKQSNAECLHWFVGNIPNGVVSKGEVLADYLQPFPAKGLGYQRFVFVLYKQNARLDYSAYRIAQADVTNIDKRAFKTLDFYRAQQEHITPAGLAFYQTNWDSSLTKFYHDVLQIKEPIYEYDFPKAYLSDQKFFPLKQPFNLYLDKHRDIKQVNKEYLIRKLAKTHPFEGPEAPEQFPNAYAIPKEVPSWLRTEIRKNRLRIGRINDY